MDGSLPVMIILNSPDIRVTITEE